MTLEAAIALHRQMLRDELSGFSPSQRTPPVAYTWSDTERAMVPDDRPVEIFEPGTDFMVSREKFQDSPTQSTKVGMPMSARMLRYLQGPAADTPWSTAFKALRQECRRNHPNHRGRDVPYWRGSLCYEAVKLTVVGTRLGQLTVREASGVLRYDYPEPILREALAYIEQHIDAQRAKAERRAKEDEGYGPGAVPEPTHEHHIPSPEHYAECPNPECRKRRAA